MPRFFKLFRILSQNLALSFSPTHHAKHVTFSVHADPNSNIHGFLHYLSFAANMEMDGVHEHYRVQTLQWSLLPFPHYWQYLIRHAADCAIGHGQSVNIPDVRFNISGAHAFCVHR